MPASAPAVLIMHLNDAPEPPSRRRPDLPIPPALEAVALRCLEKIREALPDCRGIRCCTRVRRSSGCRCRSAGVAGCRHRTRGASAVCRHGIPSSPAGGALHRCSAASADAGASDAAYGQGGGSRVVHAAIPSSRGRGQGRLIAVLLGAAALSFLAVALGGYAAYRVWTSPSRAITAETVSSDAAPATVPAMAPDTTAEPTAPPVVQPVTEGHEAGAAAGSQSPPTPAASAFRKRCDL